jgi:PII-like signaling protein
VNEDCLKLTTYFGERDRTERHLVADELLDIYGHHEVQTSILLRGVEGFGLKHQVHTDMQLSLSEDLPVVSVAVDTRPRIDALLEDVIKVNCRGLITLERARMLSGEITGVKLPEDLHEATKLTVYIGRQDLVAGEATFAAVCDLLHRRGIAGATVLLGVDGTSHGVRVRAKFFGRNADVPMMIIAVGAGEQIAGVLPELGALLRRPMLTLERVRLCKRDGQLLSTPQALPGTDEHGLAMWQKLMVYSSESAQHDGRPLHRALIRALREHTDTRGATSLRGIWGFHGDHAPHGDRLLQLRRNVPVVTIVIDTPGRVATAFELVDELTRETGLVTSEMVPAAATVDEHERHGGLRLARHRF